ncbi:MAG TPA: hypothetical protein VGN82_03465 [Bosea sp. (in: a-proteobacteria)]|jgi:hypothetical protein|uniref:hypothetical protein n=1 Tax=Bosea sp. (in: a-proteobacteria) TaxID=1871050 RepID=UPI002E142327|nr:hypothetical protein [Bosea sp. (in: a-proteobacteria)]
MRKNPDHHMQCVDFAITNPDQFREAVARLRSLEKAAELSSLGRERASLEHAVSQYLCSRDRQPN